MMTEVVKNYLKVPAVNISDHDISLRENMAIGRVEIIISLESLEV